MTDQSKQNHQAVLRKMQAARKAVLEEIGKVVVGQREPLEQLLTALFAGGHCMIQGPLATAKTILVDSLARVMSLDFRRIQFTPDLMPADISGTEILEEDRATGRRALRFVKGPVFCNILMADEINRTPPKTQAALLEVMQEKQVTLCGRTTPLPKPFYVLATQGTLQHEGTYPLPEAQQDRFMFLVEMDYLGEDQEVEAVRRSTGGRQAELRKLLGGEDLLEFQNAVRDVALPPALGKYIVALVDTSRPTHAEAPDFVKDYVYWGAGLRASQYLSLGAKSRAAQDGRLTVTAADIRGVIAPVLRHRIGLSFRAEVDGVSVDEVIRRLAEAVPAPDGK